jgi:hypothetical protein
MRRACLVVKGTVDAVGAPAWCGSGARTRTCDRVRTSRSRCTLERALRRGPLGLVAQYFVVPEFSFGAGFGLGSSRDPAHVGLLAGPGFLNPYGSACARRGGETAPAFATALASRRGTPRARSSAGAPDRVACSFDQGCGRVQRRTLRGVTSRAYPLSRRRHEVSRVSQLVRGAFRLPTGNQAFFAVYRRSTTASIRLPLPLIDTSI